MWWRQLLWTAIAALLLPAAHLTGDSDVAEEISVDVGAMVLLSCSLDHTVEECQWSWRPLSDSTSVAVVVKQFPSFGNISNDCSVRFASVQTDQEGEWTCGTRGVGQDGFAVTASKVLRVRQKLEFVQLSQGIQVNVGEPVLLRCVASLPVEWCQWSWQPLGHPEAEAVVVKGFTPSDEQHRDCSVHFANVLGEQEGMWSCAVRQRPRADFDVAPPATLTLLPPVKIRFLQTPEDTRVALGEPVILRCVAASPVTDCIWTWQPLDHPETQELLVKQFASFGNFSRDCSVHFKSVQIAQEGLWGCTVRGGKPDAIMEEKTPLAKLTTYEKVAVEFTELSKEIHIPPGNPLFLRCVTASPVQECQWSWRSMNDTNSTSPLVVSKFQPRGNRSVDCSMHLKAVTEEHEGIWTCSVRREDENETTEASPAKITLLKPEPVMVALWTAPNQKVTLACRLNTPQPTVTCAWHHPPHTVVSHQNQTKHRTVQHDNSTGTCSLILDPKPDDMGKWRCVFTHAAQDGTWELAAATLILHISTPEPERMMDWLVGVLGGLVLLLTLLFIGMLVCKYRNKNKRELADPPPELPATGVIKGLTRYTEPPSKINFLFGEPPVKPAPETTPEPHHIYEQVGYLTPTTSKSVYENLEADKDKIET
ncbi:uncharacterized protein [Anabrus simplex]|uniref:uncharacterized protein n=1 Tax=Anabrus simplex TaxID=316456 RepID=UPI0035A29D3E